MVRCMCRVCGEMAGCLVAPEIDQYLLTCRHHVMLAMEEPVTMHSSCRELGVPRISEGAF